MSRRSDRPSRRNRNQKESFSVSITDSKEIDFKTQFVKAFVYAPTGAGTSYGAMNLVYAEELKDKPLIIINTDSVLNLEDNLKLITEEYRKNIYIPRDDEGNIMVVDSSAKWLAVKEKLIEKFGDFSECAGIILDYHDVLYDAYITEANPGTPMAYRIPRDKYKEEVFDFLLSAKTNTIMNGKAKEVYVDVGAGDQYMKHNGQFKDSLPSAEKWRTPFNLMIFRDKIFAGDFEKETYRSVFTKHKLGLRPLILAGDNSNLFTNIIIFLKEKQKEIREKKAERGNAEASA